MKIALCIGHNSKAQGAIGQEGISEYKFNAEFLEDLLRLLPDKHEYKVFTRPAVSSYTTQQDEMHKDIAAWGNCEVAIEFHFNAAENDEVHGHEILYLSNGGKTLAFTLDAEYDKYLDSNDRGVKQVTSGNGYGFLKRGAYSSILVEPYFASYQSKFIRGGSHRCALLQAYVDFFIKI